MARCRSRGIASASRRCAISSVNSSAKAASPRSIRSSGRSAIISARSSPTVAKPRSRKNMDLRFRGLFNSQITPERYEWYVRELSSRLDTTFEFRLAESPLFLPDDFKRSITDAAQAIVAQLSDPARIAQMKRAIPPRWDTPGMDALPSFTQVDFAVVREGDAYVPKLIELQGFPSLTAFQIVQRDVWRDVLRGMEGLDRPWSCWFSDLDRDSFLRLARRTILGAHD